MKSLYIAAAAGVAMTAGLIISNQSESLMACDVDGDGRTHILSSDGKLTVSRHWSLSADGTQCIARNGSGEPIVLERRKLVDHIGQPLPKI